MCSIISENTYRCSLCDFASYSLSDVRRHCSEHIEKKSCSGSDSSFQYSSESKAGRWTSMMVHLFIAIYKSHQDKFGDINWTHKQIWNLIADELHKHGYQVSGITCHEKWRNLKKTYKKIFNAKTQSDTCRSRWEYFSEMDEILSKNIGIQPLIEEFENQEENINNNLDKDNQALIVHEELSHLEIQDSRSLQPSVTIPHFSSEKRQKKMLPSWYLDLKEERKLAREQKHLRHKELLKQRERFHKDNIEIKTRFLNILEEIAKKL